MKTQSSIEYLSMFSAALILLVIVIAVVGMLLLSSRSSTNVASSCYISPEINCLQLDVATNGIQSTGLVVFTNNLGQIMHFASNSFAIYPTSSQAGYIGECLPYNAVPGAEVECNATLGNGYNPSLGSELNPRFQITYSQCTRSDCAVISPSYNITGTGTTYVSSSPAGLYAVQLVTSPAGAGGGITLDGVPYSSGTYVYFLKSVSYRIYGSPPSGYTFNGWTSQGGVTVTNPSSQSSAAYATSTGAIIATFALPSSVQSTSVTLLLSAGTTTTQGSADMATGTSSKTGDTVELEYCSGTSCTPTTVLSSGTTSTTYNVAYLDTGVYTIDACDITAGTCSATKIITVQSAAQSYIYCAGDDNYNGDNTKAVYYSAVSSAGVLGWVPTNSYPQSLVGAGCSIANGYIYCVGTWIGNSQATYYAPIYYSGGTSSGIGAWTPTTPYPVQMTNAGCSIYNGYIYCVGTSNDITAWNNVNYDVQPAPVSSNDVFYAPISSSGIGAWVQTTPYPVPMYYNGCSIYHGYIYCVGTGGTSDNTEVYYAPVLPNGAGIGAWTPTTPYPIPFVDAGCSIYSGYIYCVGDGYSAGEYSSYSAPVLPNGAGIGAWTANPNAYPTAFNYGEGCAIYNGYMYCVGSSGPDVYYTQLSSSGGFAQPWIGTNSYPQGFGYAYCEIPGGSGGFAGGGGYN
jgi:hypothetical protein